LEDKPEPGGHNVETAPFGRRETPQVADYGAASFARRFNNISGFALFGREIQLNLLIYLSGFHGWAHPVAGEREDQRRGYKPRPLE
jgi:hypothetical protein